MKTDNTADVMTLMDMMGKIAAIVLPSDNPERIWVEWIANNYRQLPEAIAELGLPPVEEGPDLIERVKAAVLPVLLIKQELTTMNVRHIWWNEMKALTNAPDDDIENLRRKIAYVLSERPQLDSAVVSAEAVHLAKLGWTVQQIIDDLDYYLEDY